MQTFWNDKSFIIIILYFLEGKLEQRRIFVAQQALLV